VRLAWVELRDFRNHALTRIDPMPDGFTTVVGPNGEGKTNLLEGMFFLYALESPRVSVAEPLVREGGGPAYVRGEFETREGRALVEIEIPGRGASRVKLNRSPVRRKRDLRRQIRAVFFGPHDLPIVTGDPAKRRGFLDEAVKALWPLKEASLSAYDRALRQRNRLLKEWDRPGTPPGIEAWDQELIEAGAAVIRARTEAVEALGPPASEAFRALAGYPLEVRYAPNLQTTTGSDDVEGAFAARIEERRRDELLRRTSLVGPHRDDLTLQVKDKVARGFASHGETWAAALCLRLGLATGVEGEIGEPPLLLVDDPFSALDPDRRRALAEGLAARGGQVLISVADNAQVPAIAGAVWDVRGGTVAPRERRAS
jgi:DNA replication and repair protein RecF